MIIKETSKFKRTYKKYLINKHLDNEIQKLENIKNIILVSPNLKSLLLNQYKNIYHIEKKKGDLKEYYTARLNGKLRLLMKPVGDYPYNELLIDEIIFEEIDNSHYGEG